MKRLALLVLLIGLIAVPASGQPSWKQQAKQLAPLSDLVSNDVRVLAAAGDSLWSGPILTLFLAPNDRPSSERLFVVDDPVFTEQDNVVFSIAARNEASRKQVWAGLAFDAGGGEAGAGGFLVSTDGGSTVETKPPPLDRPSDTTITYGVSTLPAVPVTQQAGSTPQGLAFGPAGDTVWVAGARSGLRWTADGGDSWTRAVLPPDTSQSVDPTTPTNILVAPPLDDGRGSVNYLSYSVLVDETGTVWAGTVGGLNRALPSDVTPSGQRAWRRFATTGGGDGLTGDFVVALAEQPLPGQRNPIWMASWVGQQRSDQRLQRFGVTVTPDGGQSFRQTLIGERIFDLAARADRVYAAGPTGLFVSGNQGRSWRSVERFPLQDEEQVLPSDVAVRSVATTETALWVGTSEGLLRLDRSTEPRLLQENPEWELLRAQTPVNPETPSDNVPDVSTYAYPNPFVPSKDEFVRIAYELDQPQTVEINIYDFSMSQVKTITEQKPAGQRETVWRGTDSKGLRVPTGTYFYTVDLGDRTVNGKILVAN